MSTLESVASSLVKAAQLLEAQLVLAEEQRIKHKMQIPADIKAIEEVFKKNNHKLYVVGGAVRDALLGKTPKDYDLATDATPDKVEQMMQSAGFKTLPTGKAFGVINVFTDTGEYEVATFRRDIGSGRRPDAVEFTDIATDVSRRDLTINALFYDLETNEVVDLVGGVEDLKNGVVRTVGAPEDRFGEDRLRILRAIRFAGRFGSELDSAADAALQKDASLQGVSPERIRDEFMKGLASTKSVVHFLEMLNKYKLFDWVFKDLSVTKDFIEDKDQIIVIATLLVGNDIKVLDKKLNALKYSVDEIKAIVWLLQLLKLTPETAVALKRSQEKSKVTEEQVHNFGTRQGLDAALLSAFEKFKLTVDAQHVMTQFGLKPGRELGEKIYQMETDNFKTLV